MQDRSFNKLVQLLETVDPTINPHQPPVDEDHQETSMAETQINEIIRNAERVRELLGKINRDADIDAWMQSKLTLADDYLATVAEAMTTDFKNVDIMGSAKND